MLNIETNLSQQVRCAKVGDNIVTSQSQSACYQLAKNYGAEISTAKADLLYKDGQAGKKVIPVIIVTIKKEANESNKLISPWELKQKNKTTN